MLLSSGCPLLVGHYSAVDLRDDRATSVADAAISDAAEDAGLPDRAAPDAAARDATAPDKGDAGPADAEISDTAAPERPGRDTAAGDPAAADGAMVDAADAADAAGLDGATRDSGTLRLDAEWYQHAGSAAPWGLSNSEAFSANPSVMIDQQGWPVVAWTEAISDDSQYIYLKRFDGSDWSALGSSAQGAGLSQIGNPGFQPSLALAVGSDHPIVAWRTLEGDASAIHVTRYNGSNWQRLITVECSPGTCQSPSLIVGSDGSPVLARSELLASSHYEIFVQRYESSRWVGVPDSQQSGVGVSASSDMHSLDPSLVRGPGAELAVAWREGTGATSDIRVLRFDGSTWGCLGRLSDPVCSVNGTSVKSLEPSLATDGAGGYVVAWTEELVTGSLIHARQLIGREWISLGGSVISTLGSTASAPSAALGPDATPVVAWEDSANGISLRVYADGEWQEVSGSASGTGALGGPGSTAPSLALRDGKACVAWGQGAAPRNVLLKCADLWQ